MGWMDVAPYFLSSVKNIQCKNVSLFAYAVITFHCDTVYACPFLLRIARI